MGRGCMEMNVCMMWHGEERLGECTDRRVDRENDGGIEYGYEWCGVVGLESDVLGICKNDGPKSKMATIGHLKKYGR